MDVWFVFLYSVLCYLYVRWGYFSSTISLKLVSKCLPVVLLWLWAWYNVTTEPEDLLSLLLVALGMSVLGDALLVIPIVRPGGILAFALAQLLYTGLFWTSSAEDVSVLLALITAGVVFFISFVIGSRLSKKAPERRPTWLDTAILCYFLLLSLMLWSAAVRCLVYPRFSSAAGAVGALLFYASDVLIAASALYSSPWLEGRTLIMTLYYAAQLLIVMSIEGVFISYM